MISKGNILVISRTPWLETPRIRHQTAWLLRDSGYKVYYLEIVFGNRPKAQLNNEGIFVYRIVELVHHQLRYFGFLDWFYRARVKIGMSKIFSDVKFDIIFNFNYDFHFIKDVLHVPVVSIFNDDFVASAAPWMRSNVINKIGVTCRNSDKVLGVSTSIVRDLNLFRKDSELLLPWSSRPYSSPTSLKERNVVLYFGYISRLNTQIIDELCKKNVKIRFVGPIMGDGHKVFKKYMHYNNIEFLASRPLDEVELDDVCCSIALYALGSSTNAITASNRMFNLLARGIPLVYPDMPNLIDAPLNVIRKCKNLIDYSDAVKFYRENFINVQREIEFFMREHTITQRSIFFQNLIKELGS